MASKPKLFRQPPPKELVEQVLRSCGFQGLHDLRWFSKAEMRLESEEWLPELEPYYLPCKARRFLHSDLAGERLITILRHVVRAHGYDLIAQERLYKDSKQTLYQIQTCVFDLSGLSHTVDFS